jgi:putative hemolysin
MAEEKKEVQQIDIEKVIASKSEKLAKRLPKFVIKFIKKILHQDEINAFLRQEGHKTGIEYIDGLFNYFKYSYTTEGLEKIDPSKKYIFASNHPIGGLDGISLIHATNAKFGDVKFLVNDILMNLVNIQNFFIPINKHGSLSREVAKAMDEAFQSEAQILIFPAGLASRKIKGEIVDLEWQKNFILKAKQYKRDIIPVHINGRISNFFYNLANIRKFLGIKANLEMFFLPHESITIKKRDINITFGNPIPYESIDNSLKPIEWAAKIRSMVYELPNKKS